jgi:hypothetical protein
LGVVWNGIYRDYDPLRQAQGIGMSVIDQEDLGPRTMAVAVKGRKPKKSQRIVMKR